MRALVAETHNPILEDDEDLDEQSFEEFEADQDEPEEEDWEEFEEEYEDD